MSVYTDLAWEAAAYHFLGGRPACSGFGGELVLHGGQVAVQQVQGGMHPRRVALIPALLCSTHTARLTTARRVYLQLETAVVVLCHRAVVGLSQTQRLTVCAAAYSQCHVRLG